MRVRITLRRVGAEKLGRVCYIAVLNDSCRVRSHIRFPSHLPFRRPRNTYRSICYLGPPGNRRPDVYILSLDRLT